MAIFLSKICWHLIHWNTISKHSFFYGLCPYKGSKHLQIKQITCISNDRYLHTHMIHQILHKHPKKNEISWIFIFAFRISPWSLSKVILWNKSFFERTKNCKRAIPWGKIFSIQAHHCDVFIIHPLSIHIFLCRHFYCRNKIIDWDNHIWEQLI